MINYSDYLFLSIKAALEAGKKILEIYESPTENFEIQSKADDSPLTKADRIAHETIVSFLSTTPFPILSEEGKDISYRERKKWKKYWLVDPLDGTKEFIKRNGEFTVNIAFIDNGVPVLGIIYVPVRKELYYAAENEGAFKCTNISPDREFTEEELRREAVYLPVSLGHQGIVVVASRSHLSEETRMYIDNLRKQGQPVTMISSGSSLKICLVAEGSADIYPRFAPTMEWDTAAGHAIARAAGCEVYHIDEKTPLRYNKENLLNPWFVVKPVQPNK